MFSDKSLKKEKSHRRITVIDFFATTIQWNEVWLVELKRSYPLATHLHKNSEEQKKTEEA